MKPIVALHRTRGRVLVLCFLPDADAATAIVVLPTGEIAEVTARELTVERTTMDFPVGYTWSLAQQEADVK